MRLVPRSLSPLAFAALVLTSCGGEDLVAPNPSPLPVSFWQATGGPYGGDVHAIVVGYDGSVFTGTSVGGVFRSMDGGESWEGTSGGLDVKDVYALLARVGDELFVGTLDGGVYRSNIAVTAGGVQ